MSFFPQKIILTSVESDHQDYYPTFKDIQRAFVDYICLLPQGGQLIFCADDSGALETAKIAFEKRGTNGFGYDPVFYVEKFDKTTAEMLPEEKNAISHRGKALREFLKKLEKNKGL